MITKPLTRAASILCVALASCTAPPPADTGYLPAGAIPTNEDISVAATSAAANAFAYPGAMHGHPAREAIAIASLDAMAGQFSTSGRWLYMDDAVKLEMLQARAQVRAILGVPAATQSQSLIDHLVQAAQALDAGDSQAARSALSGPDFSYPPDRTLALLADFPRVQMANTATINADAALFPQGGGGMDGSD
jgi:hypothetical protein